MMRWLISNLEPETVNAPILTEELLQAGIIREVMDHLPPYKKTHKMDAILAAHLIHIVRSGYERSFVLREMIRLDIPQDAGERFLQVLEAKGSFRFGEPRYFYAPVQFVSSFGKGIVVQDCKQRKVAVSDTLAECLRLLRGAMPRKDYQEALTEYLGKKEYAEQACQTLAHQGLLMSCDSTEPATGDYGAQRWNLVLTRHGVWLSEDAWEERVNFLDETFQGSFFQSRNYFFCPPIRLCGDFETIVRDATSARYLWNISFKIQRFGKQAPINLTAAHSSAYRGLQQLRLQSPTLFDWGLTFDLRQHGDELIRGLLLELKQGEFSHTVKVRLLLGNKWPADLEVLNRHVRLKLLSTGDLQIPSLEQMSPPLRRVVEQLSQPHCQRAGCGDGLSPYIDGQGDIYSCSLEGGIRMGHIADGARVIEQRRRSLKTCQTRSLII